MTAVAPRSVVDGLRPVGRGPEAPTGDPGGGPTDWQEGDRREEAARVAWETHFTNVLVAYLETMVDLCSSLDAFMAAYPTMPRQGRPPPQPAHQLRSGQLQLVTHGLVQP